MLDRRFTAFADGPPRPSAAPDVIRLLRAFQRRWRWAIGLGLLGAALAAVAAWRLVPAAKYTAEALLLVEPEQPRLIAATREYRSDPETDRRTQLTLIRSPIVLGKALGEPEVAQLGIVRKQREPSAWLEGEIKAEFTGKILRLALSGDDPSDVAVVVKAVTAAYLSEVANKEKAQRLERNDILKTHYDQLQERLEGRRRRLRSLATEVGSNDKQTLSLQQRLAVNRQARAEEELLRIQGDLKQAMAEFKVLQARERREAAPEESGSPAGSRGEELEQAIQADPSLQQYAQRLAELQGFLADAKRTARNASDASIVTTLREIKKLREQMTRRQAELRTQLLAEKGDRRSSRDRVASPITSLEDQIAVLTELERDLRDEATKSTGDTKKLGSQAIEIDSIQDEIASAMAMVKMIGNELEILKIELNAPDRAQVLKEAKTPLALDSLQRKKLAGMAAGGTFGAVVFLISFWEFRRRKVDSERDVSLHLGLKVIGTVPAIPRALGGSPSAADGPRGRLWQHQLVESVDATRIMLTHAARADSLRVVLVTSAVGGEGKTSLASHLATSLARFGQRTLLIDGDFRRPMVHRLFDQPQEPGFCELLRGEVGLEDAVIRPTGVAGLWALTNGHFDDATLPMLARPHARQLFDRLREQFDLVIVDSAPVLPVADTLVLSQHVDAALFSVLRDVSQVPNIEAAYQRIAALGVPTLGAVVLGIEVPTSHRYGV